MENYAAAVAGNKKNAWLAGGRDVLPVTGAGETAELAGPGALTGQFSFGRHLWGLWLSAGWGGFVPTVPNR
nr:hypothetical protein [Oscillatoria sp. Prado101]